MLNIGGVEIGGSNPCRFVVEVSNAHNGSLDRALRLIDAAKVAGADFVKFQCYTPQELVDLRGDGPAPEPWASAGWTMRSLYQEARTHLGWFPRLFDYARSIGIVPFSSVFGPESLALLESIGNPCYKIAALDNAHADLITAAANTGKPFLVSCRQDWRNEPKYSRARPDGRITEFYVPGQNQLLCPPGYPTRVEDVALPLFVRQEIDDDEPWTVYLGLSSHCLHPDMPIAAVARGAKLIEMHMMLRDEPSELEANVSLDEYQFAEMIRRVRDVERMLA